MNFSKLKQATAQIKQAFVSLVHGDNTPYPTTQITYNGITADVVRLSPYGLCSNPPKGALALVINSGKGESTKYAIIDDVLNRVKDLREGEVVLCDYKTGSYVYLKSNGDIEVEGKNDVTVNAAGAVTSTSSGVTQINASSIILNANVTVNGSISGAGGGAVVMTNGATIGGVSFGSHVHSGVEAGSDLSGGPQ